MWLDVFPFILIFFVLISGLNAGIPIAGPPSLSKELCEGDEGVTEGDSKRELLCDCSILSGCNDVESDVAREVNAATIGSVTGVSL